MQRPFSARFRLRSVVEKFNARTLGKFNGSHATLAAFASDGLDFTEQAADRALEAVKKELKNRTPEADAEVDYRRNGLCNRHELSVYLNFASLCNARGRRTLKRKNPIREIQFPAFRRWSRRTRDSSTVDSSTVFSISTKHLRYALGVHTLFLRMNKYELSRFSFLSLTSFTFLYLIVFYHQTNVPLTFYYYIICVPFLQKRKMLSGNIQFFRILLELYHAITVRLRNLYYTIFQYFRVKNPTVQICPLRNACVCAYKMDREKIEKTKVQLPPTVKNFTCA